jgi:phage shock protein PspC (stress-responsive transcriptional regulator)
MCVVVDSGDGDVARMLVVLLILVVGADVDVAVAIVAHVCVPHAKCVDCSR